MTKANVKNSSTKIILMHKILPFICAAIVAFLPNAFAQEEEEPILANCQSYFEKTGICPKDVCNKGCLEGINFEGCKTGCEPKPCFEIDAQFCPEDTCQIIQGCEGKDVCFPLNEFSAPKCGGLAYAGADVECCSGLVKRCGIEFFDGSCDLVGKYSMYSIPICVPCGNGVCNQFENACNCPEDCHKEFAKDLEYKGFRPEEAKEEAAEEDEEKVKIVSEEENSELKEQNDEKDYIDPKIMEKFISPK